jgi:aminoglycoside phosphotransferase (APT) family kinase protein
VESITKRHLSATEIEALAARAFPDAGIASVEEVTDGWFSAVYALELVDGRQTILKVAPPAGLRLLTYETELMRTEIEFLERARAAGVPVPELLFHDVTRDLIDSDYLFVSRLGGVPLNAVAEEYDEEQRRNVRYELGVVAARLHGIRGDGFGYPRARRPTWPEAFPAMLDDLLDDARELDVELPRSPDEIGAIAAANTPLLAVVSEPCLVHFDLWDKNVFVQERDGRLRIEGVIDGERAFYGDPLAEFVALTVLREVEELPDLVAGYETAAGRRLPRDENARRRLALYRVYFAAIVCIEGPTRGFHGAEHERIVAWAAEHLEADLDRLRGDVSGR